MISLYRLTAADYASTALRQAQDGSSAQRSTGDYYHYTYDLVGNRLTQESTVSGLPSTVNHTYCCQSQDKFSKSSFFPSLSTKNLSICVHPCPCGYYGDSQKPCTCAHALVTKYQKRISGPLLDRIDIHIEVPRVDYEKLSGDRVGESSKSTHRLDLLANKDWHRRTPAIASFDQ